MQTPLLFDWIGEFVMQIVTQFQFWLWIGGLATALAVLTAIGVILLQLFEIFDRSNTGSAIRR